MASQLGEINPFYNLRLRIRRSLLKPTREEDQVITQLAQLWRQLSPDAQLVAQAELEAANFEEDNLLKFRESKLLASFTYAPEERMAELLTQWNFIMSDRNGDGFLMFMGGWNGVAAVVNNTTSYQRPLMHKMDNAVHRAAGVSIPDRAWTGIN